jgi:hypothetical protein
MINLQVDEPMGCYEDIDNADVFFIIGSNTAEAHPVVFERIVKRKASKPSVKAKAGKTTRHSWRSTRRRRPPRYLVAEPTISSAWHDGSVIKTPPPFRCGRWA